MTHANEAWQVRQRLHGGRLTFTRPTATLPVSLTGRHCALDCAHCGGHYLQHMHPIEEVTPGAETSYLISGGCDTLGRVPLNGHRAALESLRTGRRMNWHVGLSSEADLQPILPYVDVISFDVVGDGETAREVYGLDVGLSDYVATLEMLRRLRPVVPHITIGLRGGQLSGERAALLALQSLRIEHLIFIVFIPTVGTRYAHCAPPDLDEVGALLVEARLMLPEARLSLGCMRPMGAYRQALDMLAVRAGINAIVSPTRAAERLATEQGLQIAWRDECCALI